MLEKTEDIIKLDPLKTDDKADPILEMLLDYKRSNRTYASFTNSFTAETGVRGFFQNVAEQVNQVRGAKIISTSMVPIYVGPKVTDYNIMCNAIVRTRD